LTKDNYIYRTIFHTTLAIRPGPAHFHYRLDDGEIYIIIHVELIIHHPV